MYTEKIISLELERCRDPGTLFRESNVATAALHYYMQQIGQDYLQQTLRQPIEAVLQKKIATEHADAEFVILPYLKHIVDAIFESWPQFPPMMSIILRTLLKQTKEKFNESAAIRAVTGFLFLRFFVPAIRAPTECGIVKNELKTKDINMLGSLAAVAQKIANMTFFRETEKFYFFNDFLKESHLQLRDYIDRVTIEVSDEVLGQSFLKTHLEVNITKDSTCLIGYLRGGMDFFKARQHECEVSGQIIRIIEQLEGNENNVTYIK